MLLAQFKKYCVLPRDRNCVLKKAVKGGIKDTNRAGVSGVLKRTANRISAIRSSILAKNSFFLEDGRNWDIETSRILLGPSQFLMIVYEHSARKELGDLLLPALLRWYASLPVPATKLLMNAYLSDSAEWQQQLSKN